MVNLLTAASWGGIVCAAVTAVAQGAITAAIFIGAATLCAIAAVLVEDHPPVRPVPLPARWDGTHQAHPVGVVFSPEDWAILMPPLTVRERVRAHVTRGVPVILDGPPS